ncbi:MAG TPA: Gfo/Idh/MocA family oxidoreductase [Acidimicrobiales bacterium]|nr:Gfo/Idh/MocA family oxidoreductase [Acidimicrobiales bacterium]
MSLRVGFLGAGLIATYHSKSLRRSGEDVVWAGVYDPDPARAEAFSAASGAPLYASEDEVLDSSEAVYVCTWTAEHRRLVEAAAQRGLAVFCEKPLSVDLASTRAMADTVRSAGVTNQVGLVLRSSPALLAAKSIIDDPASGRVMSVVFRDDQFIPIQGSYASTWRGDVTKAGAGTLLEHSIHDVDVLSWLVGQPSRVQALSAGFHGIEGIEDSVAALIGFAGGAVGTLTSVWHDVTARPSLRRIEVFCERAWCCVEGDWWGPVCWTRADGSEGRLEGGALAQRAGPIDSGGYAGPGNPDGSFVRAARSGVPAAPDFSTALAAHEVVDAMYRSAGEGGVPVPLGGGDPGPG